MPLPTTLVTPAGPITLGVTLASITVSHDGHQHVFTNAVARAVFPYGDTEVRYELEAGSLTVGFEADEISAFAVI